MNNISHSACLVDTETDSPEEVAWPAPLKEDLSLMEGLDRMVLNPFLLSGTKLSPHQVDALAGVEEALREGQRRIWFEHATGSGKTIAALGLADANPGKTLILTHRRALVDQFKAELKLHGYKDWIASRVTVGTYQWFVRHVKEMEGDNYTLVLCDEVHQALGEKTAQAIRSWESPVWVGMTATGKLIARSVSDLFPVQTSQFGLQQAAKRGIIAPLRSLRIPPGPHVQNISKIPIRRSESDQEFDSEKLAQLLDQAPFNAAAADLYRSLFNDIPGVVYTAGVAHAEHVAEAFRMAGLKAQAVSGQTPLGKLKTILQDYEAGKINVLVNAQLLTEGWNSPRATVCMNLAPTASHRVYQQRIGRVTRKLPGKEAGVVIDFVHPGTTHDHPIVSIHSLLKRDIYRAGACVVGQSRRRKPAVKVERKILPVHPSPSVRSKIIHQEWEKIWIGELRSEDRAVWIETAKENLKADRWTHFLGEVKKAGFADDFLLGMLDNSLLQHKALGEIARGGNAASVERALEKIEMWPRDAKIAASRTLLTVWSQTAASPVWIWTVARHASSWHERAACARWKNFTKLLGSLANANGTAHLRCIRRIVQEAQQVNRHVYASVLASLRPHTAGGEELLRQKQEQASISACTLAAILLRNLPSNGQTVEKVGGEPGIIAQARRKFFKQIVQSRKDVLGVSSNKSKEGWVLTVKVLEDHQELPEEWMGVKLQCVPQPASVVSA